MVAALVVAVVLGAALVGLAEEFVGRARVQAVADLVALADAIDPSAGARVATANGARIDRSSARADGTRLVIVEMGGRRARAAAAVD